MVGEDNPQSADPRHALYPYPQGCAGQRLSDILGLGMGDHLALWRTNLCNPKWSMVAARERRDELLHPGAPWTVLFLLGRKVASVFEEIFEVVGWRVSYDKPAYCETYDANFTFKKKRKSRST